MICDCKKHILNKRKMCARNIRPTENVKLLSREMIFKIEIKIAIAYRRYDAKLYFSNYKSLSITCTYV